jgi:hypothetical protein
MMVKTVSTLAEFATTVRNKILTAPHHHRPAGFAEVR